MNPDAKIDLNALRIRIDEIDQNLIELIAERFKITHQVGKYKKEQGLHPIDPDREARQFEKIKTISNELNVNPEIISQILRIIIDEVVKNHQQL